MRGMAVTWQAAYDVAAAVRQMQMMGERWNADDDDEDENEGGGDGRRWRRSAGRDDGARVESILIAMGFDMPLK